MGDLVIIIVFIFIMELFSLINTQSQEIHNLYDIVNSIMDIVDSQHNNDKEYYDSITDNLNVNVDNVNKRLNQMDIDILNNDKEQTKKKEELCIMVDNKIKESNMKNGVYKTEISKKLSKIKDDIKKTKEQFMEKLDMIKVDMTKNNKNKELIQKIEELNEKQQKKDEAFNEYKKLMEQTIKGLKNEIRITKREKQGKIRGINII